MYGDIDSRGAFQKKLDAAIAEAARLLGLYAQNPALTSVLEKLRAMKASSERRDPTEDERRRVDVGVVVVRDLDGWPDPDVAKFGRTVHPLAAFYEDWPTDEEAAREAQRRP
jgi:hypothetical protein